MLTVGENAGFDIKILGGEKNHATRKTPHRGQKLGGPLDSLLDGLSFLSYAIPGPGFKFWLYIYILRSEQQGFPSI